MTRIRTLRHILALSFSNSDWLISDIAIRLLMGQRTYEIIELEVALGRSAAVPHRGGRRQPERRCAALATGPTDYEPPHSRAGVAGRRTPIQPAFTRQPVDAHRSAPAAGRTADGGVGC